MGCAQEQGYKSVNNDEFAKVISAKKVQIVDVRSSKEFDEGHIKNAVNMDVLKAEFNDQIQSLKKKGLCQEDEEGSSARPEPGSRIESKGRPAHSIDNQCPQCQEGHYA